MPNEASQSETPEPEEASAQSAEPDVADRLAAIETTLKGMNEAFGKVAQVMGLQQEQIDRLDADTKTVTDTAEPVPEGLPEGTFRFWSKYRDYGIVIEAAGRFVIDGRPVLQLGKRVDFNRGIFDTDDAQLAEYLRTHKDHGIDFYEAPDAQPHAGPTVVDGPKTSGSRRPEKPQELAARL